MQRDSPDARSCKERVGKALLRVATQQRCRQPRRFIAMQELARLAQVAHPEHVARWRASAVVGQHDGRQVLAQVFRVPQMPRRNGDDSRRRRVRKIVRRCRHPVEKRLPRGFRLRLADPLEHHRDIERVVGAKRRLLAPVRIEEALGVERDEARDQPLERRVGTGADRRVDAAEEFRELVRAQRDLRHHAKAAPAATLQPPEEIRIRAGIGDADGAIGGDDFGLEQRTLPQFHIASRSCRSRRFG